MPDYDDPVTIRIAIELSAGLADVGDLLADAQAFDAAGADILWLVPHEGIDPWPILGAFAALTRRARLATTCAGSGDPRLAMLATTMSRLSRGRFILGLDGIAADVESLVGSRRAPSGPSLFAVAPDASSAALGAEWAEGLVHTGGEDSASAVMTSVRSATAEEAEPVECWIRIAQPTDSAAWSASRTAYTALGVTGVILPSGPRSLDLVRNPDRVDDRSDLRLTQG